MSVGGSVAGAASGAVLLLPLVPKSAVFASLFQAADGSAAREPIAQSAKAAKSSVEEATAPRFAFKDCNHPSANLLCGWRSPERFRA
jgi:hypothetical protein